MTRAAELRALHAPDLDLDAPPPRPVRAARAWAPPKGCVIAVDTREQLPWFDGQPWAARRTLAVGDYSIVGCEGKVAVERKSLEDLYSTISASLQEREEQRKAGNPDPTGRGERQWRKLGGVVASGGAALVVVEATLPQILDPEGARMPGDWRSLLDPRAVLSPADHVERLEDGGCLGAWSRRYGVPWAAWGPRAVAEQRVAKWLAAWWRREQRARRALLAEVW